MSDICLFIYPLGLAYFKLGDFDKTWEEYEKIISLTTGRLWWGDFYVKGFCMRGKIYEQKGWTGKAIENYEKFLSLWRNANPVLPEAEDAKKRVAGLQ